MTGVRRHIPEAWPRGLRLDAAAEYVGLSRNTFLREIEAGKAPKPYQITVGRLVWLREDLDAYLDRIAGKVKPAGVEGSDWDDYVGQA